MADEGSEEPAACRDRLSGLRVGSQEARQGEQLDGLAQCNVVDRRSLQRRTHSGAVGRKGPFRSGDWMTRGVEVVGVRVCVEQSVARSVAR